MLTKLVINNFAIIDELSLDFENNLAVFTGETGAGKSIILGALELLLGKRANHSVILNKEKKCSIEAIFNVSKASKANEALAKKEFETYDDLIVRREISPNGRSRSFLNDTPAKLDDLQHVGSKLIDLHKQFDSYELLQSTEQLDLIDSYLLLQEEKTNYQRTFSDYKESFKLLNDKKETISKSKSEQDYLNFIYNEIAELQLEESTIEEWNSKLNLLENAHSIKEILLAGAHQLSNAEPSIIETIQSINKNLSPHGTAGKQIESLNTRLHSVVEELKDLSAEFEIQESQIEHNEEELEDVQQKVEKANKLLLKHSSQTSKDLIQIQQSLQERLDGMDHLEIDIQELEEKVKTLNTRCTKLAEQLSKKRVKGIKKFVTAMNKLLPDLGFVNAQFGIEHNFVELNTSGIDAVIFLFDANNRGSLQELRKAISGGEMSRIMLAIKSLMADTSDLPCLIFDEIDTGISGETALKVGNTLQNLGKKHQVICITHLPQIAAQGKHHYFVYKSETTAGRQTKVKKIAEQERVEALAQMLSGSAKSENALQTAQELLASNK